MTLLWPESDDVPDEEWLEESLLKKLDRDEPPPLDELRLLLLLQAVLVCTVASVPAGEGSQVCRGISV